jgi:drug/metabolite transporter (DMT)-like permease
LPEGRPSGARLYSLIALMTFLWACNFIAVKLALRDFTPLLVTGLRTLIAGFTMIPVYLWWRQRDDSNEWSRSDVPTLLLLGLMGVGLNQVCFVFGLSRTSVAHAAIVIGLTPVIVFSIAAMAGLEKLTTVRLLGMFVALSGVAALQFGRTFKGKEASLLGDGLVLLGATMFAFFTVRGKQEARRLGAVTLNTFAYIGSGVALLPLTLRESVGFSFGSVSWIGWTSLAYMAVVSSVVCYLIFYYALTWVPASRISAFAYLQPLIATLLAMPLLGELPAKGLLLGGALVLLGVFIAERF